MVKRWCGSSARAPEDAGVKVLLLAAFLWLAGSGALVRAEPPVSLPSPVASIKPAAEDPAFLALPAFDLELPQASPVPQVQVGDRLRLRLVNPAIDGALATDLKASLPDGVESLSEQGWALIEDSASPGDSSVTAVPIKSGDLTLPSLALKNPGGNSVARTNPFRIQVASAIPKDDPKPREPAPLRPPVSLKFPWVFAALLGILVLGLVAALVYGLVRWSRRSRFVAPPVPAGPPKPEDEVALAALSELEREGLAFRGQFKRHYFRVSEILKTYLGARFRFDALESTSRELVKFLEDRREPFGGLLADKQLDQLETLFRLLDRVKFTDHVPDEGEPARVLEDARRFVQETRRAPVVVAESVLKGEGDAVR